MEKCDGELINWIEGTPFGYNVREVVYVAPHDHVDTFEILICLKGEITISYFFEEFTISQGEFILVDCDAHYLYDGSSDGERGAICASVYCDYNRENGRYAGMKHRMFVCEGTKYSKKNIYREEHKHLESLVLATLMYLSQPKENEEGVVSKINSASDKIANVIDTQFDILYYYNPEIEISPAVFEKVKGLSEYIIANFKENITLHKLSEISGLSEVYVSTIMRKYSIGFNNLLSYVRAAEASDLLRTTDFTITEISELCSFSDTKYMYLAFKNWYECTPSQYKKEYREEMGKMNVEQYIDIENVNSLVLEVLKEHFVSTVI